MLRSVLLCFLLIVAVAAPAEKEPTAQENVQAALAEAAPANKHVFVEFEASWCVPCHRLASFRKQPEVDAMLSRAYVFVNIETGERKNDRLHADTPGGREYEDSIGGEKAGWPWIAILDAKGQPVVTSFRPEKGAPNGHDNIGFPSAPKDVDWFIEMVRQTAPQLSRDDLKRLKKLLEGHSQRGPERGGPFA